MWLITKIGFFSIVQKEGDEQLCVRSRVREDLEALCSRLPSAPEIVEDAYTDYRYRTWLSHETFAGLARELAEEIDYPNFKDEIHRNAGRERARVYAGVWEKLFALQAYPEP